MKKIEISQRVQVALFVLLGLAVGFGTGMKYNARYCDTVELNLRLSEAETRADVSLRALKHIRTNSTNTVAFLECSLDEAVSGVGSIVTDIPISRRSDDHVRMIRKVKDYRTQFPYKSCINHERSVARAFVLVEGDTRR